MRFISTLVLTLNTLIVSAQSEWKNYGAIDNIQEIEVYDSIAYVCNNGGLLVIDLVSGEEELLKPDNSSLEGFASEIEFLSNGHAWIISSGNLLYFDGVNFEPYQEPDTMDLSRPKSLKIYNDKLWFLDFHEELFSIKDMVITDHSAALPDDIKHFDLDSEGNVWAINKTEVYKYDGTEIISTIEIYPGDEVFRLDAFHVDEEDILWISIIAESSYDLELIYIDDQDWNVVKTHYVSKTFFEHDSLGICFGTYDGFGYIKDDTLGFIHFDSLFTDIPWGDSNRAKFKKWEGNNVWFTGSNLENPVLHRFVGNDVFKYGHNDEFLGEISDVEADCNHVLYKAGKSILEKFVDNKWEAIYPNYSDEECTIKYLEMNPFTCEIWGYGRPNGNDGCNTFWKFIEDEIIEFYSIDFGIIDLAFAPNGKIYTIISDRTLTYIDTFGMIHPVEIDSTISFEEVFISSQGKIWVLGNDWTNPSNIKTSFYVGNGDGVWIKYPETTTLINNGATCNIFEDNLGDLWFPSNQKLVRFDGTTWTNYPMSFGSFAFGEVLMDELGNFWIPTKEAGLVYWDRVNFTYYNTENSDIFDDDCLSIERVQNDLWIEHTRGLSRMKIDVTSSIKAQSSAISKPQFKLYPNPTHGTFNVESDGTQERKYEVYSFTGEHILTETSNKEAWSSSLEAGVYLVKVTTVNGESIEKLIVL